MLDRNVDIVLGEPLGYGIDARFELATQIGCFSGVIQRTIRPGLGTLQGDQLVQVAHKVAEDLAFHS
ncbi:hypothetical protein D3C87_2106810 [compost metagenome]